MDSLSIFISDIQLAFGNNESTTALFADITKAYDNVLLDKLFLKMKALELPHAVCNNIITLYQDRNFFFSTEHGLSDPYIVNLGIPQGSCLSPLLFIIYTKDLETILPPHTKLLQFADDICFYCKGPVIADNHTSLEEGAAAVTKWANNNGFVF